MFEKKNSFAKLTWAFGLGALTGAAAALWFAPMSGRKLQRKVGKVTEKVITGVTEMAQEIPQRIAKTG